MDLAQVKMRVIHLRWSRIKMKKAVLMMRVIVTNQMVETVRKRNMLRRKKERVVWIRKVIM